MGLEVPLGSLWIQIAQCITLIVENHMEKQMENEMETRCLQGCIGIPIARVGNSYRL